LKGENSRAMPAVMSSIATRTVTLIPEIDPTWPSALPAHDLPDNAS
jgi:hypothetical protein